MHTDCTLQSLTANGASYSLKEGNFTLPLDKLPAGLRMKFSRQIAEVKAEQAAFDKLAPAQKDALIAKRKADALAADKAETPPTQEIRFVISKDATGAYIVRSLQPGVSYLQSIGGGR